MNIYSHQKIPVCIICTTPRLIFTILEYVIIGIVINSQLKKRLYKLDCLKFLIIRLKIVVYQTMGCEEWKRCFIIHKIHLLYFFKHKLGFPFIPHIHLGVCHMHTKHTLTHEVSASCVIKINRYPHYVHFLCTTYNSNEFIH